MAFKDSQSRPHCQPEAGHCGNGGAAVTLGPFWGTVSQGVALAWYISPLWGFGVSVWDAVERVRTFCLAGGDGGAPLPLLGLSATVPPLTQLN